MGTASALDIAVGAVVVGSVSCSPHQWWSAAFSEEESMELATCFCFSLSAQDGVSTAFIFHADGDFQ